jgi:hypothetical protein
MEELDVDTDVSSLPLVVADASAGTEESYSKEYELIPVHIA